MITIEGLDEQGRALATLLWTCSDQGQVRRFIQGLPTVQQQDQARTIVELMIAATIDQCEFPPDESITDLLDRIAKGS